MQPLQMATERSIEVAVHPISLWQNDGSAVCGNSSISMVKYKTSSSAPNYFTNKPVDIKQIH